MSERLDTPSDDSPTTTSASTSQSILDRVRLGSVDDQRLLIALYSPLVLDFYINKEIVNEIEQREEIRNKVFATVFRKVERDGFTRQGRGAFRKWLKSITRNKVGDFIRQRKRESRERGSSHRLEFFPGSWAGDTGDADDPEIERVVLVRQAMEVVRSQVEPSTYEMARLQIVEGVSAADAGEACGKTPNAAYVAKCRVKRRLREILARFEIWGEGDGPFGEQPGDPS